MVDFVTQYIETRQPPDFRHFHYRAPLELRGQGKLHVMAAGRRGDSYAARLARIDWQSLYETMDGFLLMEDLKAQWEEQLRPDYVLIDARTGHSEVGGICTRQLPDTVVVLFIPNEQNLAGLKQVVAAIRAEARTPTKKEVGLEFVASNVPALDDEEAILKSQLRRFSKELGFHRAHVIERYDSLHLMNQSIFVRSRPASRLAKQYRALTRKIVDRNIEDREAALRILSRDVASPGTSVPVGYRRRLG